MKKVVTKGYLVTSDGEVGNLFKKSNLRKVTKSEVKRKMEFIPDLLRLKRAGFLPPVPTRDKGGLLYFHLTPLLEAWLKDFYNRTNEPVLYKSHELREYIKKQPGFVAFNVNQKIRGRVCRCTVFVRNKAPVGLLELLDGQCMDKRRNKAPKPGI